MTDIAFHTGADAQIVARWVAERIPGCERGFGPCTAMAVRDGDKPLGAVVFHNWCPEAGVIEMSSAADSPRWLTRRSLYAIHSYAFDVAQLAVMRVAENNERMRRIGRAYGYEEYRIPRLRGRDEAEIIMTLTDDAWRASRFHKT